MWVASTSLHIKISLYLHLLSFLSWIRGGRILLFAKVRAPKWSNWLHMNFPYFLLIHKLSATLSHLCSFLLKCPILLANRSSLYWREKNSFSSKLKSIYSSFLLLSFSKGKSILPSITFRPPPIPCNLAIPSTLCTIFVLTLLYS